MVSPGSRSARRGTLASRSRDSAQKSKVSPRSATTASPASTSGRSTQFGSGSRCTRWRTPTTGWPEAAQPSSSWAASAGRSSGTQATTPATVVLPRASRNMFAVSSRLSAACTSTVACTPTRSSSGSGRRHPERAVELAQLRGQPRVVATASGPTRAGGRRRPHHRLRRRSVTGQAAGAPSCARPRRLGRAGGEHGIEPVECGLQVVVHG